MRLSDNVSAAANMAIQSGSALAISPATPLSHARMAAKSIMAPQLNGFARATDQNTNAQVCVRHRLASSADDWCSAHH
jgi:hypothetical protein